MSDDKHQRRRDDRPKTNPKEDLGYRISALEKTKTETGMSAADIAALDRVIAKLYEQKAAKAQKPENQTKDES